jgi:spore coat protein A, manganese oxidase
VTLARTHPSRARVALCAAVALIAAATLLPRDADASHVAFVKPLTLPPVLTGSDITIDMQESLVPILPGAATKMWTYGGTFPGPTIRRKAGEATNVTFVNDLPASVGSTTVHLHGAHAMPQHDGQPEDMVGDPTSCEQNTLLIPTGCSHTYRYDLVENGAPERAAMQWYHDHRMDVTGRNVWMGLAGMFIIDPADGDTTEATLPSGEYDVPLMLTDRKFDANNQLNYEFLRDGMLGDHALVNGIAQPYFEVATHRYRVRVLNASNARAYDLTLSNGKPMTLIGTESGLLPAPVTVTHMRLGPAERAELVIDLSGASVGDKVTLVNTLGFTPTLRNLMEFRVARTVADDTSIPATLRPLPDTVKRDPSMVRTWILGEDPNPTNPIWTINGQGFSHHRVDTAPLNPKLGATEEWIFVNETAFEHVVHIHDVDWRLVFRTGSSPLPAVETSKECVPTADNDMCQLKESFLVRPYEAIGVVSTFTDHVGRYMFHCHILEHEDKAMMAQFEVVP